MQALILYNKIADIGQDIVENNIDILFCTKEFIDTNKYFRQLSESEKKTLIKEILDYEKTSLSEEIVVKILRENGINTFEKLRNTFKGIDKLLSINIINKVLIDTKANKINRCIQIGMLINIGAIICSILLEVIFKYTRTAILIDMATIFEAIALASIAITLGLMKNYRAELSKICKNADNKSCL